jgi:hypothetical protein
VQVGRKLDTHRQKNKREGEEQNLKLLLRKQILWEKSIQYTNETEKERGRENWGMR